MPRKTITVRYVNPPTEGRRQGSIKDMEGRYYGCYGDKIEQFEVGKTYDVEFSEKISETNGTVYYNVQSAREVAPIPARSRGEAAAQRSDQQHGSLPARQPTHPTDSQRMFICSLLNAFIQAGILPCKAEAIRSAIIEIRTAYDFELGGETQGAQQTRRAAR